VTDEANWGFLSALVVGQFGLAVILSKGVALLRPIFRTLS
jgi:hypothetical protein